MKVIDIIRLLRDEGQEISIREDNYFIFKTTAERLPEEYHLRKIIDIIPNYDLPDIEKDCFVINLEGKGRSDE